MGGLRMAVHAAPSLGLPQGGPVGGAVTGAPKAFPLDQSFEEQRAVAVTPLSISGQLARIMAQDLVRPSGDAAPEQIQGTAVIDDLGEVGLAIVVTPTDPCVAAGRFPGGTGELQAGEEREGTLLGADQ